MKNDNTKNFGKYAIKGFKYTKKQKEIKSQTAKKFHKIKKFGFQEGHKKVGGVKKGFKQSEKTKEHLRTFTREKSSNWKGGITSERERIRNCWEYRN